MFKDTLEIQIEDKVECVKDVEFNKKIILVSLKTWEDEQEVMGKKGQLNGSELYINHDLSRGNRNIQRKLKEIARQEREKGGEVRLGFRKNKNKWALDKMGRKKEKQWFFYSKESRETSK